MKNFFCILEKNLKKSENILFPARFIYFADAAEGRSLSKIKNEMQKKVQVFKEKVGEKTVEDIGQVEGKMGLYTNEAFTQLNNLYTEGTRGLKNDPTSTQELKNFFEQCRREIARSQAEFFQIAQYARRKAIISTQLENLNRYYVKNIAQDGKVRLDVRYVSFLQAAAGQIDTSIKSLNFLPLPGDEPTVLTDKKTFTEGLEKAKSGFLTDAQSILSFQDLVKNNPELATQEKALTQEQAAGLQNDIHTIAELGLKIAQLKSDVAELTQNPSKEKFFQLQKQVDVQQEEIKNKGEAIFAKKMGQGGTDLMAKLYQSLWEQKFRPLTAEIEVVNAELSGGPEIIKVINEIEAILEQAKNADNDLRSLELTKGEQNLWGMEGQAALELENLGERPAADAKLSEGIEKVLDNYTAAKKLLATHNLPAALRASIEKTVNDALNGLIRKKTDLQLRKTWNRYGDMVKSFSRGTLASDPKFLALPKEDQQKVLIELQTIQIDITEDVEAKTCPRITESFWEGKALVESGNYEEGRKKLTIFLEVDLQSREFSDNPVLREHKNIYLLRTNQLLLALEKVTGSNKNFFEARKAYEAGRTVDAKKLLKAYLAQAKGSENKEDFNFVQSARDLLKAIALQQYVNVKARFEAVKAPPRTIRQTVGKATVVSPNPEYQRYQQYIKRVENIRHLLENGDYIDFSDAYEAESKKDPPLDPNYQFNFLADEIILDKGRAGLLILARKYREHGQYELAESYFMQYFSKQLNALKEKRFNLADMRKKWTERPQFMVSVKTKLVTAKQQYNETVERKGAKWAAEHPWDDIKMRGIITDQALQEILPQELQKAQQDAFHLDPSSLGSAEEQEAWAEFANMQGIHRRGTWAEPFAMTDAELDQLVKELPMDIAFMALSAIGAGLAAGVAQRAILQVGLSQLEKEVLEFGTGSLQRRALAYLGGFFTENVILAGSNTARQTNSDTTLGEDLQNFRQEWNGSLENLVRAKLVSAITGGIGLGSLGSTITSKGGANALKVAGFVGEEFSENALNASLGGVTNAAKSALDLNASADYGKMDAAQDTGAFVGYQVGSFIARRISKAAKAPKNPKLEKPQNPNGPDSIPPSIPVRIDEGPVSGDAPTLGKHKEPLGDEQQPHEAGAKGGTKKLDPNEVPKPFKPGEGVPPHPQGHDAPPDSDAVPTGVNPKRKPLEVVQDLLNAPPEKLPQRLQQLLNYIMQQKIPADKIDGILKQMTAKDPGIIKTLLDYKKQHGQFPFPERYMSEGRLLDLAMKNSKGLEIIQQCIEDGSLPLTSDIVFKLAGHPEGFDYLSDYAKRDKVKFVIDGLLNALLGGMARKGHSPEQIRNFLDGFEQQHPPVTIDPAYKEALQHYAAIERIAYQTDYCNNIANRYGAQSFKEHLHDALKGEGDPVISDALRELKERDPRAHELLADNYRDISLDGSLALITGNKKTGHDRQGQEVLIYTGKYINKGGMGSVSAAYFVRGDGKTLEYGVIKTPHNDDFAKNEFGKECDNAEEMRKFESPVNQAIVVNKENGFIIYESGQDAKDLFKYIQNPSTTPQAALTAVRSIMVVAKEYAEKGLVHGDIKLENAIIYTGPDGRVAQVIDNNPVKQSFIVDNGPISNRPLTPDHAPGWEGQHVIDQNRQQHYPAIDAFAVGVILSNPSGTISAELPPDHEIHRPADQPSTLIWSLQQKLPPEEFARVKAQLDMLARDCKNPVESSKPGFWDRAIEQFDNIINSLPGNAGVPQSGVRPRQQQRRAASSQATQPRAA